MIIEMRVEVHFSKPEGSEKTLNRIVDDIHSLLTVDIPQAAMESVEAGGGEVIKVTAM